MTIRTATGTSRAAESADTAHQQAPDDGVDDAGGGDGNNGRQARRFRFSDGAGISVTNDAGNFLVALGPNKNGDGLVATRSPKSMNDLVVLTSSNAGGMVTTYKPNGKELVQLGGSDSGGVVGVNNKTGESIAQMYADEYGNGVVWAGNRKGMGRTLKPGP